MSDKNVSEIAETTRQMIATPDVTRVEVIVHGEYGCGREYVSYCDLSEIELSYQDGGRTLKIFAKRNVYRDVGAHTA